MKKILCLLSLLAGIGFALPSHAGLLLEPSIGYEMSVQAGQDPATNIDNGGKTSGLGFGLRAGYKLPMLIWLAADYSMMSGGKFSSEVTNMDGKVDRSNLYLDVGVDFPILVRAWVGYGIGNTAKVSPDSGGELKFKGGSQIKVGAGFTGFPFVSLNLEYFSNTFDKVDMGAGEVATDTVFKDFKDTGLLLSVSLPFNL
jgi:hypothetical protein